MLTQDDASPGTTAQIRRRWQPVIRKWLGSATELMLDLAQIRPGSRILDIAAGEADLSLQAARRAAPGGRVVVLNRPESRLAVRPRFPGRAGRAILETVVMDGAHLAFADQSFDVILSRLGGRLLADIPQELQEMHRVLKPAGRASLIALTQPERNPFLSIPLAIIRTRLSATLPDGEIDVFRLGGRGMLEKSLIQAGFRQVETHILSVPLRLASAAECVRFERDIFAVFQVLMAGLGAAAQAELWREVEAGLAHLESAGGFTASGEVTVAVGGKCG